MGLWDKLTKPLKRLSDAFDVDHAERLTEWGAKRRKERREYVRGQAQCMTRETVTLPEAFKHQRACDDLAQMLDRMADEQEAKKAVELSGSTHQKAVSRLRHRGSITAVEIQELGTTGAHAILTRMRKDGWFSHIEWETNPISGKRYKRYYLSVSKLRQSVNAIVIEGR